jgi:hypothetical protein
VCAARPCNVSHLPTHDAAIESKTAHVIESRGERGKGRTGIDITNCTGELIVTNLDGVAVTELTVCVVSPAHHRAVYCENACERSSCNDTGQTTDGTGLTKGLDVLLGVTAADPETDGVADAVTDMEREADAVKDTDVLALGVILGLGDGAAHRTNPAELTVSLSPMLAACP